MDKPTKIFNDKKGTFTMDKRTLDRLARIGDEVQCQLQGQAVWNSILQRHSRTRMENLLAVAQLAATEAEFEKLLGPEEPWPSKYK